MRVGLWRRRLVLPQRLHVLLARLVPHFAHVLRQALEHNTRGALALVALGVQLFRAQALHVVPTVVGHARHEPVVGGRHHVVQAHLLAAPRVDFGAAGASAVRSFVFHPVQAFERA